MNLIPYLQRFVRKIKVFMENFTFYARTLRTREFNNTKSRLEIRKTSGPM